VLFDCPKVASAVFYLAEISEEVVSFRQRCQRRVRISSHGIFLDRFKKKKVLAQLSAIAALQSIFLGRNSILY
jgi:hypothetical protein